MSLDDSKVDPLVKPVPPDSLEMDGHSLHRRKYVFVSRDRRHIFTLPAAACMVTPYDDRSFESYELYRMYRSRDRVNYFPSGKPRIKIDDSRCGEAYYFNT